MKLFVSFSGGETSGYMAQRLRREYGDMYEMVFGFANTGEEHEATLTFADRCDKEFDLRLVWLEAVVHEGRTGCTHKVVDFASASRNGEPFEQVIRKYGIPNKAYPHCTRELKLNPIRSYLESIGWDGCNRAVGIRADEPKRLTGKPPIVYPLAHWFPMDKPGIISWWEDQPFRLGLKNYQGNCKWCWKKVLSKHVMIANESPEVYDFPLRMEAQYGLAGHNLDGTPRTFFRENRSAKDIISIAQLLSGGGRTESEDDGDGCSGSCEASE